MGHHQDDQLFIMNISGGEERKGQKEYSKKK